MKKSLTIILILSLGIYLVFPTKIFAALAVVQTKSNFANGSATVTATMDNPTGTGNLIYVACVQTNGTVTLTPSVTGTAQTFVTVDTITPTGGGKGQGWYVLSSASGTTAFTCTRSAGSGQWGIVVIEVSGTDPTSPLDQHTFDVGVVSTTANSGTTGTTAQADEIVVGFLLAAGLADGSSPTITGLTAGYTGTTNRVSTSASPNNNVTTLGFYQIVSATGTFNASGTVSTGVAWSGGMIATFKAATGAGTPTSPRLVVQAAVVFQPGLRVQ